MCGDVKMCSSRRTTETIGAPHNRQRWRFYQTTRADGCELGQWAAHSQGPSLSEEEALLCVTVAYYLADVSPDLLVTLIEDGREGQFLDDVGV